MRKKYETFSKFVEFKVVVEKEVSKKVKALRSDNGYEYVTNEFKFVCAKEGIQRELKSPHNPQHNGVVERKDHSTVGVMRAMMHDQGIPLHLWDEACNTIVYLQKWSPHQILSMITLEEDISGRKLVVSHFMRELHFPLEDECLDPKEEHQEVVEKAQIEERRVETSNQVEPSREGRKRTREAEIIVHNTRENVGAPSNQCRQRNSPDRYTRYMALMIDLVEIETSSFEEAVEKPIWVNAIVEHYQSIVKNSVWEVVPRPVDKSVVGSRWTLKVKQAIYGIIEKYKNIFVAKGYSQVEGIDSEETFSLVLMRYYKEDLVREFAIKDMVLMHYFLRLEVWQGYGELFFSQGKYANEIL
eukprot:PITA_18792